MLELGFILINLLFAVLVFYLVIAFITGAPFVPSTNEVAHKMIELAKIKPGEIVYDLGSGDGRLLFLSAQKRARAIGVEINPYLVFYTKLKVLFSSHRTTIHVIWKSFWKVDMKDADVIFIYLLPWRMEALETYLQKQLKPGTRVVSNSFIFPHMKKTASDTKLHVYAFMVE